MCGDVIGLTVGWTVKVKINHSLFLMGSYNLLNFYTYVYSPSHEEFNDHTLKVIQGKMTQVEFINISIF